MCPRLAPDVGRSFYHGVSVDGPALGAPRREPPPDQAVEGPQAHGWPGARHGLMRPFYFVVCARRVLALVRRGTAP
jgi:hypothetical protein